VNGGRNDRDRVAWFGHLGLLVEPALLVPDDHVRKRRYPLNLRQLMPGTIQPPGERRSPPEPMSGI
jgi:hypothetical protein